jgi:hypothetical protein
MIKKAPEDGIPYSKRYIQQEINKHLEKHGFYKTEQGKNIINLGLDPDSEDLAFVFDQFDEELRAFLAKITRLRKIIDELEQMGGRRALPPIEVETTEMKIDMPPSPVVPSWGWGSLNSSCRANDILEASRRPGGQTWGGKLLGFFRSPDIFPMFSYEESITKSEFITRVNSIPKIPIPVDVNEAFLIYYNQTDELFTVSIIPGRISVNAKGWEIAAEANISPLLRSSQLIYPTGINEIERVLLRNKDRFNVGHFVRETELESTRRTINEFLPADERVSKEHFVTILSYWALAGVFFVQSPK